MRKQQFIKSIIVVGFFGFLLLGSLSSCEDDAILELENNEECVGSYCKVAVPNAKESTIALVTITNPNEF